MERVKAASLETSDQGLALITDFEGAILYAYDDKDTSRPRRHILPGMKVEGVLTIGSGHTRTVKPGDVITEARRLELLRSDVREAERLVQRYVTVPVSQNEFDALVSLMFQQGPGRMRGSMGPDDEGDDGIVTLKSGKPSTLLRKLNEGDYSGCAPCFTSWRAPGTGAELGLSRRRIAEMLHFMALPWKAALNTIKFLPIAVDAALAAANEEKANLDALAPPAPDVLILDTPAPAPIPPAETAKPKAQEAQRPPPKPAPPPRQPGPSPQAQASAVNASQASGVDWSGIKPMIRSRRFWGLLLIVIGRLHCAFTGGTVLLTAATDPIIQEIVSGVGVMVFDMSLAACGAYIQHRGERGAKAPLGTSKEVALATPPPGWA